MTGPQFSPASPASSDGASKPRGSDHPYSEFILDRPNPHGSTRLMSARAWMPGHCLYLELGWCLCSGLSCQGV